IERVNIVGVVVRDALEPRDLADRMQRQATDLAHPLGDLIGRSENLVRLLVEQQMIVAEMRAADMPMEILGLEIECKRVSKQRIERARDVAARIGAEIGRCFQRRLAALLY